MARPVWKGHISFGLVNVPVNLYTAEQRADLQLHMIDSRDHSRVRYERVNEETGAEVPWNEIVRGYEYNDGNYVIISEEEMKRAAPEATKRVEIEAFVAVNDIDPVFFDRPYFLEPGKGGEKGYVLLRDALEESGRVGIARVVIRTRQYLAAMMPRGDVLVLELLRYAQELRSPADLNIPKGDAKKHGVSAAEMKMARTLVDSMTGEWEPASFKDEYRAELMKWIEKKVKSGGKAPPSVEVEDDEDDAPAPLNFMELLQKSIGGGARGASKSKTTKKKTAAGKKRTRTRTVSKKKPVRQRKAG